MDAYVNSRSPEASADRTAAPPDAPPRCPISVRATAIAALLNAEFADHEVYDGFELQWFDDAEHGTGMLAFLTRRDDHTVDYYVDPSLTLDRGMYSIGAGVRTWNVVVFRESRLDVHDDGVEAAARFVDVDGRSVEIAIDDRDGSPRRRGALLAPVSSDIERPTSLLLVWMPQFDLVRRRPYHPPVVRIGGETVALGRLPGASLHRRELIKYAAPVLPIELNRDGDPPATEGGPGKALLVSTADALHAVTTPVAAGTDRHEVRVSLEPAMPDPRRLDGGVTREGRWCIGVDDAMLTGGTWSITGAIGREEVHLDVTRRWRPRHLPPLMRLVTRMVPVFRRWPTTYAWRATVPEAGGPIAGRWRRTGDAGADGYRRATGS